MALFQPQYFEQIPIADYTNEKEKLIEKSENQISKTASINKKIARFSSSPSNQFKSNGA